MANAVIKAAISIAGTLASPSKMPCHSTSTPAEECITGSKLREIPGSVCFKCYAFERGNYRFTVVQDSLQRRLDGITHPGWVDAMVTLIETKHCPKSCGCDRGYFRWDDSGDIQSIEHLARICEIARRTPDVMHWLPTREYKMVEDYEGAIPSNLTIRLSAHMVDGQPPSGYGLPTSTVVSNASDKTCPAKEQGNKCLRCRDCWNPKVTNVAYPRH